MDRDAVIAVLAVAFLLTAMVAGGLSFCNRIDHEQQRTALEFKEICEAKSGQAVWNGRYWECLR